ncbi:MAG: site-specific integrase [Acidimicrobiia bacterium]
MPKVEPQAWTAQELQAFLREAAGHRLFPALWPLADTGMPRSELLGLQWDDVDLDQARISVNRGLVSIGYELHVSRGKTSNSRRAIDLAPTTVAILSAWKEWQASERGAVGIEPTGWVFADVQGNPIHTHSLLQAFERIVARSGVSKVRLHDIRHTHGTLLIKAGVPVKVVSERPSHGTPRVHHRHLPTRTTRDSGRSRPHLRAADRQQPVENPVEATVDERLETIKAPVGSSLTGLSVAGAGFEPATFGL